MIRNSMPLTQTRRERRAIEIEMSIRKFLPILFALFALLLAGCGGGGSKPQFVYETDWTNRAALGQITGRSQRITFFDSTNTASFTRVINNTFDGPMSFTYDINPGTYMIQVELFSDLNAAGTLNGLIKSYRTISGSSKLRTSVGSAISGIAVTPTESAFKVGSGRTYVAAGTTSDSRITFIAPNSITWSQTGAVVSLDSSGAGTNGVIATGTALGSGSVRGTHSPSSLLGAASVQVTPTTTTRSKWTVMVYLNAASDLYTFSPLNFNQMESVAQNADVRFVVQWKLSTDLYSDALFNGTRRYLVKPDTTNSIRSELIQDMGTNVDMGDYKTLQNFVGWAKANYPADRYCLVIWSHGNGWRRSTVPEPTRAVSFDDVTGSAIQIWELPAAIGSEKLDIVSWDASLMQMMEVAYELKDSAKFVVGSEESPPGEGLPYDTVFGRFRDNPDETTGNLTKSFVDGMLGVPGYVSRKITQSSVDTTKLGALATALDSLAATMIANSAEVGPTLGTVRTQVQRYSPSGSRQYADIYDLAAKIKANTSNLAVQLACDEVQAKLLQAVLWNGNNAQSPRSYGLSIDFSTATGFSAAKPDYLNLQFAEDTRWDDWLTIVP